jgi:hypothetical protein
VQEARSKGQARGDALGVANALAHRLQLAFGRFVHL